MLAFSLLLLIFVVRCGVEISSLSLSLFIYFVVGFYVCVYFNIGLADENLCFMFDGFLF